MKKLFCIVSVLFLSVAYGRQKVQEVSHYLFPDFEKGSVLMKSGVVNETLLNYNSLTQEMIFDTKGKKLALTQLENIDTVYIVNRKFVIHENKFVELIFKSRYELFAEYRCKIKDPGKPSAYGGTSQTSSISTYSSYFSGGQAYELKLPVGIETKPYVEYWIRKDSKMTKFLSIRQFLKIFDVKENDLKEFVKKNNVRYENPESIIALLKHLESK